MSANDAELTRFCIGNHQIKYTKSHHGIVGKSFMDYFQNQQDWGDGGMQAVVTKHYQLSQRDQIVQQFIQQALASVRS